MSKYKTSHSPAHGAPRLKDAEAGAAASSRVAAADGEPAPAHSIVDYLSARIVLIGFIVLEVAVIVLLTPNFIYHRMDGAVRNAVSAKDYEKAYARLKTMNAVFGRDPDRPPATVFGRWIESYARINPALRNRYHLDGARYLVQAKRYEEAGKLLDQLKPTQVPVSLRARILYETGQRDAALEEFAKVAAKSPDAVTSFYLGRDLFEKALYVEATLYLRRCVNDAEFGPQASEMLAQVQQKLDIAPVGARESSGA